MRPPYVLIPDALSHDTIQCLEAMLDEARSGELIGIAFGAIFKRRTYIVNSAGEAYRSPTFARGIVAALDDELSARIRGNQL